MRGGPEPSRAKEKQQYGSNIRYHNFYSAS